MILVIVSTLVHTQPFASRHFLRQRSGNELVLRDLSTIATPSTGYNTELAYAQDTFSVTRLIN